MGIRLVVALVGQERLEAQIKGQRFIAAVRLIKALWGGWKDHTESAPDSRVSLDEESRLAVPALAIYVLAVMANTGHQ